MDTYQTKEEVGKKRIVFITGTRADFGKIKSLLDVLNKSGLFDVHIFATGMHMLARYGYTAHEIEKCNFPNVFKYINSSDGLSMENILANTIVGIGNYLKEYKPDMIVVHGDRIEALAGALAGSFNNIMVSHIEGGEISGTIDEHIRHSISKMANLHFVANNEAKKRLVQMGELPETVYVIGSPDIDIMNSKKLPSLKLAQKRYNLNFSNYGILIFHPVTSEIKELEKQACVLSDAVTGSKFNYIVVYPNNDSGTDIIQNVYKKYFSNNPKFRICSSIRFEYFLTLLKNANFIIGNSSAGIREAPYYGIPTINLGTRQINRVKNLPSVFNCDFDRDKILSLIDKFTAKLVRYNSRKEFGNGNSHKNFFKILKSGKAWSTGIQKQFRDVNFI